MTGPLKDLLGKLQGTIDADTESSVDLAKLLAGIDKSLEEANKRDDRKAKQEAKRAELKEGGKRAAEKDWVTSKVPTPVVPDVLIPPTKRQAPIAPPKPVAERSVDELYQLLAERVQRYRLVVSEGLSDKRIALANVYLVTELLEERGEETDRIAGFVQSELERDVPVDELHRRLRHYVSVTMDSGKTKGMKAMNQVAAIIQRLVEHGESEEDIAAVIQSVMEGSQDR
jgi:hypothetical protein